MKKGDKVVVKKTVQFIDEKDCGRMGVVSAYHRPNVWSFEVGVYFDGKEYGFMEDELEVIESA